MAWLGLETAELAQVGSAAFAAMAAGASWASVAQTRRERKAREVPDVHMGVLEIIPTNQIKLHFANYGGPAKQVTFCVLKGGMVAYGRLPPVPVLNTAEERTLATGLPNSDHGPVGAVWCYDRSGRRLHASAMNGEVKSWSSHNWLGRERTISDDRVFAALYPGLDPMSLPMASYEVIEKSA